MSLSKTITSRLSPVSFSIRQTAFWMKNRFHRREKRNTATVIHFLGKSSADAAGQAMSPDIRPAKTEADTRRGAAMKLQTMAGRILTGQVTRKAALAGVSVMRMRFIYCILSAGN